MNPYDEEDTRSLESAKNEILRAKEKIHKAEAFIKFVGTNPPRHRLIFYLEENNIHHSNHALNVLDVYF